MADQKQIKAGRMMLLYLSEVAKAAREHAGRSREGIADKVGVSSAAIRRFERGESWPKNIDLTITSYAEAANLEPLELWQRALDLWHEHGEMPLAGREAQAATASQRFAQRIAATARQQAQSQDRAGTARKSTSTAKRQAAR